MSAETRATISCAECCAPPPKAGVDAPKEGVALGLPKAAGELEPKAGVLAAPKLVLPNAGVEAPKPVEPKAGVLAPKAGADAAPNAGCRIIPASVSNLDFAHEGGGFRYVRISLRKLISVETHN